MRARFGSEVRAGPIVPCNRACRHVSVINPRNAVLGCSATNCLSSHCGSAVGRPKLDSRISVGCYSSDEANGSRLVGLRGVAIAVVLVLAADVRYVAPPHETFGVAGILWIASIGMLVFSIFPRNPLRLPRSPTWEIALLSLLFLLALFSRVWNP